MVSELTSFIDGLDLYNYWYTKVFQGLFTMAAVLKDEVFMAFWKMLIKCHLGILLLAKPLSSFEFSSNNVMVYFEANYGGNPLITFLMRISKLD